jgi:4-hydroxybutyrate CoA-transferase
MASTGLAELYFQGVVTNRYNNLHPGVSVAAAWSGLSDGEVARIERHPAFRLEPVEHVLDIGRMSTIIGLTSINNAISVDLIGQINAESVFDGIMRDGSGGQPEAHISAFLSTGGRAVTLLRSYIIRSRPLSWRSPRT